MIKERVDLNGLYLSTAETLSEIINITKLLVNNHSSWIIEQTEVHKLIKSISGVYSRLNVLYDKLFTMEFEELNKNQRQESDSSLRDDSSDVSNKFKQSNTQRISQYVNQFKNSMYSSVSLYYNDFLE